MTLTHLLYNICIGICDAVIDNVELYLMARTAPPKNNFDSGNVVYISDNKPWSTITYN